MIAPGAIQTIADKSMDRQEFLQDSGLVLLTLVGLAAIASLLAKTGPVVPNLGFRKYGA